MKDTVIVLGWLAAVGFCAWALWKADEPVLACLVALLGTFFMLMEL